MSDGPGYFAKPRPAMLPFVPAGARRILDIGCGEGSFAARLREERGAQVWGVELDPAAAAAAAARLDRVLTGDITALARDLPDGGFDCIVMNDLLEHLLAPGDLLVTLRAKLAPGGCVVASIPNVRSFANLWNLVVHGEWRYTDEGILDRTHLRFFTRASMGRLFAESGYRLTRQVGVTPTRSWKFRLVNLLALGRLADARWLQFACVAEPRDGARDGS
jgi:2-polyprenyl-3-methyl-5-hydroxy-6-metoxy-1,4-benzoquinol methylase